MKRRVLWLAVAMVLAAAMIGAAVVVNAEEVPAKNGTFNGSPAHVDENGNLYVDAANFPDASFREYIKKGDTDEDGVLTLAQVNGGTDQYGNYSPAPITSLGVSDQNISDLSGIEFFTSIVELYCHNTNITELDLSANTALTRLYCYENNNLSKLDLSANTALAILYCNSNNLTELDVSANTELVGLHCYENNLTELDVSANTKLVGLSCFKNNLTELDVSANTALTSLSCYGNNLTELDVSANTALESLSCGDNNLTKIDVSANTALGYFDCSGNSLTSLDVSKNTALENLWCQGNNLTELDVSKNIALGNLGCSDNSLTSLDVSKNTALINLWCNDNSLTELDVSKNTELEYLLCDGNNLTELDVSNNTALISLHCNDNSLKSLDVSKNTALELLRCQHNNITSLDVSANTALQSLAYFSQTYTDEITLTKSGDTYMYDLSKIVGAENIALIESVEYGTYDSTTGVVTFEKQPIEIVYYINVPNKTALMDVSIINIVVDDKSETDPADTDSAETEPPVTEPETSAPETTTPSEPETTAPEPETTEPASGTWRPAPETTAPTPADTTIVMDEIKQSDIVDDVIGEKYTEYVAYDISLKNAQGVTVQPDGKITVTIPVPEAWNASDVKVFHVSENGAATDMNASPSADGKSVSFVTDHFSIYVLVNAKSEVKDAETIAPAETTVPETDGTVTPPTTGDASLNVLAVTVAMMCTCAAGVVTVFSMKKHR